MLLDKVKIKSKVTIAIFMLSNVQLATADDVFASEKGIFTRYNLEATKSAFYNLFTQGKDLIDTTSQAFSSLSFSTKMGLGSGAAVVGLGYVMGSPMFITGTIAGLTAIGSTGRLTLAPEHGLQPNEDQVNLLQLEDQLKLKDQSKANILTYRFSYYCAEVCEKLHNAWLTEPTNTRQSLNNLYNNTQMLQTRIEHLSNTVHQIQHEIARNDQKARRGIAATAALGGATVMPSVPGKTTVGAGIASYESTQAIAISIVHRPEKASQLTIQAGGGISSGGKPVMRIGASYEF